MLFMILIFTKKNTIDILYLDYLGFTIFISIFIILFLRKFRMECRNLLYHFFVRFMYIIYIIYNSHTQLL